MMRLAHLSLALALLLGGLLMPAAPARAHAELVTGSPAPDSVLATVPPRLQLLFSGDLGDGSDVRVIGPNGQRADRRDLQVDGVRMWVSLVDQGPGRYQVRWRAVADEDEHAERGSYTFSIQSPPPASAPRLNVSRTAVTNGQSLQVSGSGFAPNSTTLLVVGDAEDLLATVPTDARGAFSTQVTLPAELPFGRQVLQAIGGDRRATAALRVASPGGLGLVAVRLSGAGEEDSLGYTLRVENLSGFALRDVIVRAQIPAGTAVLLDDLGQPDDVDPPVQEGDRLVWRLPRLPAHSIGGPFEFAVTAPPGADRPAVTSSAMVEYRFTNAPQAPRGAAWSATVRVRAAEAE